MLTTVSAAWLSVKREIVIANTRRITRGRFKSIYTSALITITSLMVPAFICACLSIELKLFLTDASRFIIWRFIIVYTSANTRNINLMITTIGHTVTTKISNDRALALIVLVRRCSAWAWRNAWFSVNRNILLLATNLTTTFFSWYIVSHLFNWTNYFITI